MPLVGPPPSSDTFGPVTYRVGKKTYQLFYMNQSINANTPFPSSPIVAPCFGVYRLEIIVGASAVLSMATLNLSTSFNAFNNGNPLTPNTINTFEFPAFPNMQFQFQLNATTNVNMILTFEGECSI